MPGVQSTLRKPLLVQLRSMLSYVNTKLRRTTRTTRLLAIVSLALSILGSGLGIRQILRKWRQDNETGRRLLRRNSGLRAKDGTRTIFVPYRNESAAVKISPTREVTFDAHRRLFLQPSRNKGAIPAQTATGDVPPPQTKPGLNLAFLHQFMSLLSIMIPRWNSKESGLLLSHGVFLMFRTYLSLVVARLDGVIVRDLVARNGRAFLWNLLKWCGLGTLASYTNAAIKFLQAKVAIAFRTRLTRYIHDLYLNDKQNYYKLLNLDGGIGGSPDQLITQDVTMFCNTAAAIYSSIGKPFVDLCVFNYQLYSSLGPLAFAGLMGNYFFTAALLRKLSPPFGKLKAAEGRKEGDFRFLHARLIANAEEVAFYRGQTAELDSLDAGFGALKHFLDNIYRLKIGYNMLEDFVLKYSWSAFGYLVVSLPVFAPSWQGMFTIDEEAMPSDSSKPALSNSEDSQHSRMKNFITNKRLMLSLADAGGRLMYSLKDLAELAGHTSRVFSLLSTLHRVHANAYFPAAGTNTGLPSGAMPELFSLADVQGTIQLGFDGVRFENVPIVAPGFYPAGGEELIQSLSFVVKPGDHLLITGPNGVGKTSIARVLAGLWPAYRGLVSRPRSTTGEDGIMFLPQRPYLSTGTLRDQVIYPHTVPDMESAGFSDDHLQQVLNQAHLGYLVDREGGWDTRKNWKDVLSGGEKQRMGFARVYYHQPQFVVIDEGTSAVSSDVEGTLYDVAKDQGSTLITISTRASLKRYHTYTLTLAISDISSDQSDQLMLGDADDGTGRPHLHHQNAQHDFFDAVESPEVTFPRAIPHGAPAYFDPNEGSEDGDRDGDMGEDEDGLFEHDDHFAPPLPLVEWSLQRVGTQADQSSDEKELADLRAQLAKVNEWEARYAVVEKELAAVSVVAA